MTVNNDIDDDSATKHSDSHTRQLSSSECLIEEIHSARELLRVGTPLTKMVVSVHVTSITIRTRPSLLLLHFAEDRFISGIKSSQHDRRHSLNRSLRMRLVRQSATMQLVSIHLTMSG